MLIVDAPPLDPGHCIVTQTSEGPFIDTLIDYDDLPALGRVYIAKDAVMSMAQMFGATPPETAVRREARISDLEARLDQALVDIAGLKTANEALIAAGYGDRARVDSIEAQVPGGGYRTVIEWIAAVEGPERLSRAQAALTVERDEAQRSTVIDYCEKVLSTPQEVPA